MEKEFVTKDFNLAALFVSQKLPFSKAYWENGTCFFVFSGQQRASDLKEAYLRGHLSVNARDLFSSQRFIKDLIHEGARNQ